MSTVGRIGPPIARIAAPRFLAEITPPLLARPAILCAVVLLSACVDAPVGPPDATHETAPVGARPQLLAADEVQDSVRIVDPTTNRIALTISTDDDLSPNVDITLNISGVAQEVIDGGEVILTLPTKAAMDYPGPDKQPYFSSGTSVAAFARWDLPAMQVDDTWEQTVTIPAAVAGYYQVVQNACTHGPNARGLYLPSHVREGATEPSDWNADHIRATWLLNLK